MPFKRRRSRLGRGVDAAMRGHPGFPNTIHVAVVQVENGVVRRGGRKHVAAHPDVHLVVQAEGAPAFDRVAEAGGRAIPGCGIVDADGNGGGRVGLLRQGGCAVDAKLAVQTVVHLLEIIVDVGFDFHAPLGEGEGSVGNGRALAAEGIGFPDGGGFLGGGTQLAIPGPIPIGQAEGGVSQHALNVELELTQHEAVPGTKDRSAMRGVAVGLRGRRQGAHRDVMPGNEDVISTDGRVGRALNADLRGGDSVDEFVFQQLDAVDVFSAVSGVGRGVAAGDGGHFSVAPPHVWSRHVWRCRRLEPPRAFSF